MNPIVNFFININNFKKILILGQYRSVRPLCSTSSCSQSEPEEKSNQKIINVAVIGVPNAGKSTFINNLINHRICPTSNKVHTTRNFQKAVYTTKDTQIILYDTPGLVTEKEVKKFHLESSFNSAYRHSIQHADMIAVIHDISNSFTRNQLHPTVFHTLQTYPKLPSFLVLNKIDTLKSKRILLDLVRTLTNNTLVGKQSLAKFGKLSKKSDKKENPIDTLQGWNHFSDVFMVSSIMGDGLREIMNYLLKNAKHGKWQHPADFHTDDTPEELIVNSVKARLLDYLPQEIPYNLKSEIEYYSIEKNCIYASVLITCPNERIERLICGAENGKLKQITERVTSDLVETFKQPVTLTIVTTTKKSTRIAN